MTQMDEKTRFIEENFCAVPKTPDQLKHIGNVWRAGIHESSSPDALGIIIYDIDPQYYPFAALHWTVWGFEEIHPTKTEELQEVITTKPTLWSEKLFYTTYQVFYTNKDSNEDTLNLKNLIQTANLPRCMGLISTCRYLTNPTTPTNP